MFLSFAFTSLLAADLFRVDVPNHPEALATSALGSTLVHPPTDGTPWREAPIPEPTNAGLHPSIGAEAREAMNVDEWHEAGHRGAGVSVAVFDIQWFGHEFNDALTGAETHDCFAHRSCDLPIDTVDPQFAFETGGHGIACAEVIRSIAPDVELHLVRVNGLTALENAVEWAVSEGIDIVSMSMSFFNESFYDGTGSIADAMDTLVAGGTLMVASAGNYARQHHSGAFNDADLDGRHEFSPGSEYLAVYLYEGTTKISVLWDEYHRCGTTDIDVYVYDADGDLVGRSTRSQDPESESCFPAETVTAQASEEGWHWLTLHRSNGTGAVAFNVLTRSGYLYQAQASGSVTDPGSHPDVFTVGAVDADGYRFNDAEGFSSQGPTPAGVRKPNIAGPDGLSTSIYGPGRFFGTSASTPSVAAAIALLMSEDPALTPREAANALAASAVSDGPHWMADSTAFGAGKARLHALDSTDSGCSDGMPMLFIACWLPVAAIRRRRRDSH